MSWSSWAVGRGSRSRPEGKPRAYANSKDETSSPTWGNQQWTNDEDPSSTPGAQQHRRRRPDDDKVAPSSRWGGQAWARYHRSEEKISPYTWSEDDAETRSGNSRGSRALSPEASTSWASDDDERHGSESAAKNSQMDGRACGQALLNMVKKPDRRQSDKQQQLAAPKSEVTARVPKSPSHQMHKAAEQLESAAAAVPTSSAASAPSASTALKQLVRTKAPAPPAEMAAPENAALSASAALARLIGGDATPSAPLPYTPAASATSGAASESAALAGFAAPASQSAQAISPAPVMPSGSLACTFSASSVPLALSKAEAASGAPGESAAFMSQETPPMPMVSSASAPMLPRAPAGAAVLQTSAASGSRSQAGTTKLRSSASMFVPAGPSPSAGPSHQSSQVPSLPQDTYAKACGGGKDVLADVISKTFGTEIWNVQMVECEEYTGRSYIAVEIVLPMQSSWAAGQPQQDQAALQNLQWNLQSVEMGVQSVNLSADGAALQMEYCGAAADRLCWDFAHHGFCPRPACRWAHVPMERFVINVSLRPGQLQKPLASQGNNLNNLGQLGETLCVVVPQNGQATAQMTMQPIQAYQVGKAVVVMQPMAQQSAVQPLPPRELTAMPQQQPFIQAMPAAPMPRPAPNAGLPMQHVTGTQHQELNMEDPEEAPWQDCAAPKHEGPAFFDNEADPEDVNGASDSAKRVSWADIEDEDGEEIDLKQWAGPQLQ